MSNKSNSCVIRKLVLKHCLIDAYPIGLLPDGYESADDSSYVSSDDESLLDSSYASSRALESDNDIENEVGFGDPLQFERKEDQDVFVFKEIMKQLPPAALLKILRESKKEAEAAKNKKAPPADAGEQQFAKVTDLASKESLDTTKKEKHIHFSRDGFEEDGDIEVECNIVEKFEAPELWWKVSELNEMRSECVSIVHRYIDEEPGYIESVSRFLDGFAANDVATMATGCSNEEEKVYDNNLLETLAHYYEARGLEHHIVDRCRKMSSRHVRGVLREGRRARHRQLEGKKTDGFDDLRKASLKTSAPCVHLARMLANCDRNLDELLIQSDRSFEIQSEIQPMDSTSETGRMVVGSESNVSQSPPKEHPLTQKESESEEKKESFTPSQDDQPSESPHHSKPGRNRRRRFSLTASRRGHASEKSCVIL